MGLAIRLGWIYGAPMDDSKDTQAMPISCDDAGLITMDLTGLKCPVPVLKARRQISQMPAGGILVVIADDPAAPLDFDHFARPVVMTCWKALQKTVSSPCVSPKRLPNSRSV